MCKRETKRASRVAHVVGGLMVVGGLDRGCGPVGLRDRPLPVHQPRGAAAIIFYREVELKKLTVYSQY